MHRNRRERRDEKGFGMASIDSFSDDYEMNEKADSRHEERRADDKV